MDEAAAIIVVVFWEGDFENSNVAVGEDGGEVAENSGREV